MMQRCYFVKMHIVPSQDHLVQLLSCVQNTVEQTGNRVFAFGCASLMAPRGCTKNTRKLLCFRVWLVFYTVHF